ncbi:MAG: host specificity protein J [Stenomitos frigidus ULC029]
MNTPSDLPLSETTIETSENQGVLTTTIRDEDWQISGSGIAGGGKGGGKGARTPVEDRNSLRSIAYVNVLYLLSEGEISGYPSGNGLLDIYLDDTPILSASGQTNFSNLQLYTSFGTQTQNYIPGFSDIQAQIDVSTKVTYSGGPITRTLNDLNADVVVVSVLVPQLQEIDPTTGDIRGSSVTLQILISQNGGVYTPYVNDTITGKTTSNYQRSYRIRLPKPGPWQIRLTRVSFDSGEQRITNDLYFASLTSIIETKLGYPFSALLGLSVSAEQFKSLPRVSIELLGLKIQIPSNYDPFQRIYFGNWNGTFNYAYSNNPAWVLYDFLTNNRYGCGKFLSASQIDKWSFYQIAQYCDGLVPDGKGGFEPRFTCNAYIQNRDDAYNMINALASVFRGMVYWASGTIFVSQDAPAAPVRLFTEANVKQEVDAATGRVTKPTFSYAGSSAKARHTAVLVTYADADDQYNTKVVYVEDRDGIARYGYRETQVTAFGCTSIGQAHRVGKWLLYTEQNETETISFTVGAEGLLVRPGEVIKVADPLRAGSRMGGRLLDVVPTIDGITTFLYLDDAVTLIPGQSYTVSLINPVTGYSVDYPVGEGLNVGSPPGTATILTILNPAQQSDAGTIWLLSTATLQPQLFKVVSVNERTRMEYDITATAYNASKFNAIEQATPLVKPPISRLPNLLANPAAPSALFTTEALYRSGAAGVQIKVDISFQASPSVGVDFYQIEVKDTTNPDSYTVLGTTGDLNFTWLGATPGIYDFRVHAVNKLGYRSEYATKRLQVVGKNKPPGNVTNLTASVTGLQILLKWDSLADLDIQTGGFFKIKFTSSTSNVSWSNGFDVLLVGGGSTSATVPAYAGTYLIKAVSPLGYASVTATTVDTTFAATIATNVVLNLMDSPTFAGAKTNTIVANGILQLGGTDYIDISAEPLTELIDDSTEQIDLYAATIDDTPGNIDDPGDGINLGFNVDDEISIYSVVSSGSYAFSQIIDLGAVFLADFGTTLSSTTANLFSNIDSTGFDTIDETAELIDGEVFTEATIALLIAISNNGINYSEFQKFSVGSYLGRFFKFRLDLATTQSNYNVLVDAFGITVDMPDRTDVGTVQTVAVGVQVVNYQAAFKNSPLVGITLVDGTTGDYYTLSNQQASGFTIFTFNAAGTQVSRQVNWIAKGYGKVIS